MARGSLGFLIARPRVPVWHLTVPGRGPMRLELPTPRCSAHRSFNADTKRQADQGLCVMSRCLILLAVQPDKQG